jgi:hypothetical protein
MNIFVLDSDAVESARMMCDKHVVKMILESAQLLSTAHHVLDGEQVKIVGKRSYTTYKCDLPNICKATMINHPCTIWTRENSANYLWLWKHGKALCNQYTMRYNKRHVMEDMYDGNLFYVPKNILKSRKITPFAQAMPDQYKDANAVIAYRNYYLNEKSRFAKWKIGNIPEWYSTKDATYMCGVNELIPF